MKIVDVRIEESILPKKDKDWKFALAANPATEGWTVAIRAEDGTIGYGYASTMNHYGAPHEAVKGALDRLCKRLIGRDSRQIAAILDDLDHAMTGNNQAKAGIDCALHDLLARRLGVPICDLFGGAAVREFPSLRILPIKSPADMAKNARMLAEKGVRHFKVKVHGDVEEDVERVRAIRAEVVDFGAVRNRQDRPVGSFDPQRLIVEDPIAEPGQPAFGDVIERMERLTAARPRSRGSVMIYPRVGAFLRSRLHLIQPIQQLTPALQRLRPAELRIQ